MGTHDDAFLLDAHDGLDRLDRLLEEVEGGGPGSGRCAADAAEVCRGLFEAASQLRHRRFAAPALHLLAELEGLKAAGGEASDAAIGRLFDSVDDLRSALASLERAL